DKTAWSRFKANLIITVVGHKYRHLKSSSLQSLERGQLTEIDYFNGYIVRKADEIGIDVPINRQLVAMIKKIEAKQLPIQLSNLDDVQI
ncbi:MAG TPA: ketopantoate reductase C-terminal domain-containing protein, partial [Bacilli bacterium]|nr:ketopantoate reductase C-terminal domain-containing protein [Bacilli bacterium]